MVNSDFVAGASLFVSLVAFLIAILDWLQIGREEPWQIQWTVNGGFILKRQHYWPVWIQNIHNFHGGQVNILNDAASIPWPVKRNAETLLRVDPVSEGTFITVCYRRLSCAELLRVQAASLLELLPRQNTSGFDFKVRKIQNSIRPNPGIYWDRTELTGRKNWSTPVLAIGR